MIRIFIRTHSLACWLDTSKFQQYKSAKGTLCILESGRYGARGEATEYEEGLTQQRIVPAGAEREKATKQTAATHGTLCTQESSCRSNKKPYITRVASQSESRRQLETETKIPNDPEKIEWKAPFLRRWDVVNSTSLREAIKVFIPCIFLVFCDNKHTHEKTMFFKKIKIL